MGGLLGFLGAGGTVHGNIGPASRKRDRDGASDAATGSGHERGSAGQVEHISASSRVR